MTKAVIKSETKEETILREYRHLRTIIAEERAKVKYLDGRMEQLREKRKDKLAVIEANEIQFKELRAQAAQIVSQMLDEGED